MHRGRRFPFGPRRGSPHLGRDNRRPPLARRSARPPRYLRSSEWPAVSPRTTARWGAATAVALLGATSALVSGCLGNGADDEPRVIEGDTATVYSSAAAARRVSCDRRRRDRGRAACPRGARRPRRRPEDQVPQAARDGRARPAVGPRTLVAENASRAADDPTAIAYLGELDYGATAVSLPITNDAGLLQVSPGDGLTSLTRRVPGRPRAGPERYYPTDRRSFVRVGPDRPRRGGTHRRTARCGRRHDLRARLRPRDLRPRAGRSGGRPRPPRRPQAGRGGGVPRARSTTSRTSPAGLRRRSPTPSSCSAWPAAARSRCWSRSTTSFPACRCSPRAESWPSRSSRCPRGPIASRPSGRRGPRSEAGYQAMRLVLDAVAAGGRDRRRVVAAALRRRTELPADTVALYRPDEHGRFAKVGR